MSLMDDSKRENLKHIAATKEVTQALGRMVENAEKMFGQMPPPGSSQFFLRCMVSEGIKGMAEPLWTA